MRAVPARLLTIAALGLIFGAQAAWPQTADTVPPIAGAHRGQQVSRCETTPAAGASPASARCRRDGDNHSRD
jgi:hypothetical protein